MSKHNKIQSILQFWFADSQSNPASLATQNKLWWGHAPETDAKIKQLFGNDVEQAASETYNDWLSNAEGRLALIILCDQFTRNIYRNTAGMYELDALALQYAQDGIANNHILELPPLYQVFMLMPLEHAEDKQIQAGCVAQFQRLLNSASIKEKATFQNFLDFAIAHQRIINQFGHFPHRNEILGRDSSPEEIEFLKQPNSGF